MDIKYTLFLQYKCAGNLGVVDESTDDEIDGEDRTMAVGTLEDGRTLDRNSNEVVLYAA